MKRSWIRRKRADRPRLDPHRFSDSAIPKVGVRVRDESVMQAARDRGVCEVCGLKRRTCGHHVKTKGSGGFDEWGNIVVVCDACHSKCHTGEIPKERLYQIIESRQKPSSGKAA